MHLQGKRDRRRGFDPWVGKIPSRRNWQPTPGFLPGESHRQRSLAGYGPRDLKESDMTERLSMCANLYPLNPWLWVDSWCHTEYNLAQFSSVAQSCLTLCDPLGCSTPGLPVHHQLPELAQSHVHWVSDAIQPSLNILGTYRPGEFIFQRDIFLPFHAAHGLLKARILKWFAIAFSSGPHFVRTLHHDLCILGNPTQHGS